MIHKSKRQIISLILLVIILSTPIQSYAQEDNLDLEYFNNILKLVEENYIQKNSTEELMEKALKGLFNGLDEYSSYYNKDEFTKLNQELQGNFVGIGVYIMEENGYIKVVRPIQGSPAEKAGLLPDDIIITVDGKTSKGLTTEEVSNLIKGDIGTEARFRIRRNNYIKIINVVRDNIVIDTVQYEIIGDTGYIKLKQFNDNSYDMMLDALSYMDKHQIDKIILDLRDNPGGYLDQAIYIANLFVPEGPLVHIQYGKDKMQSYNSFLEDIKYELVVLINENTASASEILSAAIKDTKAGTLVGATSFGKGTVQQLLTLPREDGIKLTIAEYFSPNMLKIDGLGVEPDITVENKANEDTQLKAAFKLLSM